MILFHAPGASSQAPHILLREAGLPFDLVKVDLATHAWSGGDYRMTNPKAYIPALKLDDGDLLTECAVILQWIADQVPDKHLLPASSTRECYHAQEWLNFIATELHKNFIHAGAAWRRRGQLPVANPGGAGADPRSCLAPSTDSLGREYLSDTRFTAPDAYLFTMLTWTHRLSLELTPWPNLAAFFDRMRHRPAVSKALAIEGPPHACGNERFRTS